MLAALVGDPSQPAIARASAAQALGGALSAQTLDALRAPLAAADPLLRLAAVSALEALPDEPRLALAAPLLDDPLRAVRIEAAWVLSSIPDASFPAARKPAFERAAAEYETVQRYNFDRPEARTSLGTFYARRGRAEEAENSLRSALALEPRHVPAYVNIADLKRGLGRDAEGEAVLREGLALMPDDATLHHVLGLTLVRLQRADAGLAELARAAALAPDDARFAYVYAVGLYSNGKPQEALAEIDRALVRHPAQRELLLAGASFSRESGARERALDYAQRLVAGRARATRRRCSFCSRSRPLAVFVAHLALHRVEVLVELLDAAEHALQRQRLDDVEHLLHRRLHVHHQHLAVRRVHRLLRAEDRAQAGAADVFQRRQVEHHGQRLCREHLVDLLFQRRRGGGIEASAEAQPLERRLRGIDVDGQAHGALSSLRGMRLAAQTKRIVALP